MKKEMIMHDSPEAAKPVEMTMWRSANGTLYTQEEAARYAGCTHNVCDCGSVKEKMYTCCEKCRTKKKMERYCKMPEIEWDGVTPLVIFGDDTYFFSEDDLTDYCADNDCKPDDLMLVECEPNHYQQIDSDYWSDVMPEDSDGDIPKVLQDKLNELNDIIKALPPASWSEGRKCVKVNIQL